MRKWSFFAFCFLLLLAGCKYEDGPLVSLRGKQARVVGAKKVESYIVNGVDSTFLFDSLYAGTEYGAKGMFFDLHDLSYNVFLTECGQGHWGFNDQTRESMYIVLPNCLNGEFTRRNAWHILRLTHRELWLESEEPSDDCQLRFKAP